MKKRSPKQKAKDKAWKVFSEYVRLHHADSKGYCRCVTCGKKMFWKGDGCQAGHFVDSRNNVVLFDERLVHPQCVSCNMYKAGNKIQYVRFMVEEYGFTIHELDAFDKLKFKTKKMTEQDFLEIWEFYKEMVQDKKTGLELKCSIF